MTGSARVAALGASLVAAAVGVLAGAALQATSGGVETATAAGVTPPVEASPETAAMAGVDAGADQRVAAASDAVITEAMGDLVAGRLSRRVMVVGLGGGAGPGADTVAGDLRAAGAVVDPATVLLDGWLDESLGPLRSGLAAQLSPGDPAGAASLDVALALALSGNGEADPPTVLAALVGAGLAVVPTAAPAVEPPPEAGGSEESVASDPDPTLVIFVATDGLDAAHAGWTEVISTWQSTVPAMDVLVAEYGGAPLEPDAAETPAADPPTGAGPGAADGGAPVRSSLVAGVRQGPLAAGVSTVDHADSGLGRLSVVRWAARGAGDPVGHYGLLQGAGAIVAPRPAVETAVGG